MVFKIGLAISRKSRFIFSSWKNSIQLSRILFILFDTEYLETILCD